MEKTLNYLLKVFTADSQWRGGEGPEDSCVEMSTVCFKNSKTESRS